MSEIPKIEVGTLVVPTVPHTHFQGDSVMQSREVGRVREIRGDRALVQMKSRALKWFPLSGLEPAATPIVRPPKEVEHDVQDAEHRGNR